VSEPVTCPVCHGAKRSLCFVNRGEDISTHTQEMLDCLFCRGWGTVSKPELKRWQQGRTLRDARVARGESLMQCAKRFGMSSAELSAVENGRAAAPDGLLP
jgi:hypothetical protein